MAKTLKRKLGNRKPFFRVAWDTEDILELVGINRGLKGRDIDWRRVEKYVFKLQKLIYRASSCGNKVFDGLTILSAHSVGNVSTLSRDVPLNWDV